jgi:tetratricopeptide (TPR) repeat protein
VMGTPTFEWKVRQILGMAAVALYRTEEAREHFRVALDLDPSPDARGAILLHLAPLLLADGLDEVLRTLGRAVELLRASGQVFLEAQALLWWSMGLVAHTEFDEARRAAERALELARAGGWQTVVGWALRELGRARFELGWPDARESLEEGVTILREFGQRTHAANGLASLAEVLAACGESARAWALAREAVEEARSGANMGLPYTLSVACRLAPDPETSARLRSEGEAVVEVRDPFGLARQAFAALRALEEGDPSTLDRVTAWYAARGERMELARLYLERARRDPGGPWAAAGLALVPPGSRLAVALAASGALATNW